MKQVTRKASKGQKSIPTLASILMVMTIVASLICAGYPSGLVSASDFAGASEFKLTASDGATNDYFGNSVAISGDTVVVGAQHDDVGGNASQGSAYVFARSATNWTQQAQLIASDGEAGDAFGYSVAISGDTALIGAYYDDVGANDYQGSAYIFTRSGTDWTEQTQLTASDAEIYDMFGYSVAISGDTAVVGAPMDSVGVNDTQGSAYVFVRNSTNWTEQAHLIASDGAVGDNFGISVAISGDTAVVGSLGPGGVYVFTRSGTDWTEQAQLTASDGVPGDAFGNSVAISGDTAVVGAPVDDVGGNEEEGSAYVFTRSGTSWTEQAHLNASDGAEYDLFGISVGVSADTALIGAWGTSSGRGSAYVFTRSGSTWTQRTHLTASDGVAGDAFGVRVAISDDTAVVGAWHDTVGEHAYQGSAYVYYGGEHAAHVSATVTLQSQLISVVISDGYPTAVEYGVMLPDTEAGPTAYIPDAHPYLRVENDGNVVEDLLIKGANAVCDEGTWILAATPGTDQYSHSYGLGETPGSYTALDYLAKNLSSNVTVGGTVDFNVKIHTPTNSTVYGQYYTTVTVTAVAHTS